MTDLSPDIEQAKLSLADKYISDLRKELGFFEGSVLYMVEKTLKDMLLQQEVLGEKIDSYKFNRLETFLIDLFPNKAEYIYKFVRDKQIVLVQAKTKDDLEKLQQGISPSPGSETSGGSSAESADNQDHQGQTEHTEIDQTDKHDNHDEHGEPDDKSDEAHEGTKEESNPVNGEQENNEDMLSNEAESVVVAVAAGEAARETEKAVKAGKAGIDKMRDIKHGTINLAEGIDVRTTKQGFEDVQTLLRHQLTNPHLTPEMKAAIQKSMDEFERAKQNASVVDDLKLRKSLGNKLPPKVCETLFASLKEADQSALAKIAGNKKELQALADLTDPDEIKLFLKNKGIANSSDELVHIIAQTKDMAEMRSITRVLSQTKKISKMAKVASSIHYLDVIAIGFDYRMWQEGRDAAAKESEINKLRGDMMYSKANTQFTIQCIGAGVSLATGIAAGLAASGPVGWVVLGVGAASYAVSEGINYLYFDVLDFYTQNKADYINQYRIELKQAILQATIGSSSEHGVNIIAPSMNESVTNYFGGLDQGQKSITLEDAYRALIYQEEIEAFPLLAHYGYHVSKDNPIPNDSKEVYNKQKENLEKAINSRMAYIQQYLPKNNIGQQSEAYRSFMTSITNNKSIESIEGIITRSKTYAMVQADPTISDKNMSVDEYKKMKLLDLKQQDEKLRSICEEWSKNSAYYDEIIHHVQTYSTTSNISTSRQQVIDYILSYDKITRLNRTRSIDSKGYPETDFNSVEALLDNPSQGYAGLKITYSDAAESIANGRVDKHTEYDEELSGDNLGQDFIYKLYRQQGYTGKNTMIDLIAYGKEVDKGSSLGIYYDAGWKINEDRAIDGSLDIDDVEKLSVDDFFKKYFTRTDYLNLMYVVNPLAGVALSYMRESVNGVITGIGINPGSKNIIDTKTETADKTLNTEFSSSVKSILIELKVYRTPEYKRVVTEAITNHINQYCVSGSMVKLPSYLIEAAHNAHIGPVEHFLFGKDDNQQIIGLTSSAHNGSSIDLPGGCVIQYVSNIRDSYTSNEQILIDDADRSLARLQRLRDIEGSLRTREDEINIMPEWERILGNEAKNRAIDKKSLLCYHTAYGRSEFLQSYRQRKQFFDHMYLSFLLNSASNTFNNNNNSNEMMFRSVAASSSALEASSFIKINDETKKKELIIPEMFAKSNNIQNIFQEMGDFYKPYGKESIKELLLSDDTEKQKQGTYYALELLICIVEGVMCSYDDNGVLIDITSPKMGSLQIYKEKIQQRIVANIKSANGNYMYDPESIFNRDDISAIAENKLEIKTVSDKDNIINKSTQDITRTIEKTDVTNAVRGSVEKVNKQDQRGNINYDQETSILTSRGRGIKIDGEKKQIEGLGITLGSIEELIRLANLTNMALSIAQKNDPQKEESFSRADSVRTRDGIFLGSTRIVIDDTFRSHCPSIPDDKIQSYIDYLNKRPEKNISTIKKEQAFI